MTEKIPAPDLKLTVLERTPHFEAQVVRVRVEIGDALRKILTQQEFLPNVVLSWPHDKQPYTVRLNSQGRAEIPMTLPLKEPESADLKATLQMSDGTVREATTTIPPTDVLRTDFQDRIAQTKPVDAGERVRAVAGEYQLEETLEVHPGGTLILDPGVNLLFGPNGSIYCAGTLIARGTEKDLIYMAAQKDNKTWGGVFLNGPYAMGSRFEYCGFHGGAGMGVRLTSDGIMALDSKAGERWGGALLIANSGPTSNSPAGVQLSNVRFEKNQATHGGGLAVFGSTVSLENVDFENNQAEIAGGGLYADQALVKIGKGVNFSENTAGKVGGGLATAHRTQLLGSAQKMSFKGNQSPVGPNLYSFRGSLNKVTPPKDSIIIDKV